MQCFALFGDHGLSSSYFCVYTHFARRRTGVLTTLHGKAATMTVRARYLRIVDAICNFKFSFKHCSVCTVYLTQPIVICSCTVRLMIRTKPRQENGLTSVGSKLCDMLKCSLFFNGLEVVYHGCQSKAMIVTVLVVNVPN
jgi:hypothetical protein